MLGTVAGYLVIPLPILGVFSVALSLSGLRGRKLLALLSPLLLGVICFTVAFFMADALHLGVKEVIGGGLSLILIVGAVSGSAAALGAFQFEKWLSRQFYRRRRQQAVIEGALPASLQFVGLPSSGESFMGVRDIARVPWLFAITSAWTIIGEELLYRGVVVIGGASVGLDPFVAVVAQGVFYSLNHLAFDVPALAGKLLFGVVLGLVALWTGSVLPCLVVHAVYQVLVYRQMAARRSVVS
ncbi:MAG: hypothetical protein B5766_00500 [Candidatus Lumbricidophila eiseniae]|uniref:CAAX prenyl protease 2/Lysostaphin resistance protein A-like domain-containing protein n=1 Tax=Candidatus Lumbricidiphila eiseniae TaxID=1969409 RepID=A0A2A6FUA3_9MICO|nr:MAG: hypothetical protein B5766_00500 [Candidatus Lumbricidophila eiseniae]